LKTIKTNGIVKAVIKIIVKEQVLINTTEAGDT